MTNTNQEDRSAIQKRLAETGRNDNCPCGSGKKYKKCHLRDDEAASAAPAEKPDPKVLLTQGWRLFEQRRPSAAEKQFRAALEIDGSLTDAEVGIGMAKLSAGDNDAAKQCFETVIVSQAALAEGLAKEGVTDAFNRPEAQPYIRASHALGCLLFDEEHYEQSTQKLALVHAIDAGPVGTEARMVAAKALVKLGKPAEAVAVLEPGLSFAAAAPRVQMGLSLAHYLAGDPGKAERALDAALEGNPHLGKAVLGLLKARVAHPAAATPGSREEASVYAQGFGDVWDDAAKDFLRAALARRNGTAAAATTASASVAG